MSKVDNMRQFVGDRLSAAAEEIFGVFAKTIAEYERELQRQREKLAAVWQPEVRLLRIDGGKKQGAPTPQQPSTQERVCSEGAGGPCGRLGGGGHFALKQEEDELDSSPAWNNEPHGSVICADELPERSKFVPHTRIPEPQSSRSCEGRLLPKAGASKEVRIDQRVFKEEAVSTDRPLGKQRRTSSLDQQDPWPSQSGEEPEDSFSRQEGELLAPKQEDDALSANPIRGNETSGVHRCSEVKRPGIHEKADPCSTFKETMTVSVDTQKERHVFKEEELPADQQLSNQDGVSRQDQEDREREGLCSRVEGELTAPNQLKKNNAAISYMIWVPNHSFQPSGSNTPGTASPGSWLSHPPDSTRKTRHKRYTCNVCGKMFVYRLNFETHMRVHTGERPFSCTVCERRFPRLAHLMVHMRSHRRERPPAPSPCGKKFSGTTVLNRHMKTQEEEKTYTCGVCEKTFSVLENLTLHVQNHTGDQSFPTASGVKGHHTQPAPFSAKAERKVSKLLSRLRPLAPKPSSIPVTLVLNCPISEAEQTGLQPEQTGLQSEQTGVQAT